MAAQSLTTFDASLKDFYEGLVRKVLNRQSRLYKYVKKGAKNFTGRQVLFPVNLQGSPAAVFMPAGEDLPAAVAQSTSDVKIPIKQIWCRIQVLHDVIEAARDNRGAFERPVALEVKRMTEDLIEKVNRAMFGDGTGQIAEVDSYQDNTPDANHGRILCRGIKNNITLSANFNGNAGNRYIKNGDILDVYNGAAARTQGAVVTAVNIATDSIDLQKPFTGANPAAGDKIFVARPSGATPIGNDCMGLGGIIDDGTFVATLHNIDRTGVLTTGGAMWKAQVINAGASITAPAALSLDMMQRAVDMASEGGMGFPAIGIMHYSIRREYIKLVVNDRRYVEKYKYEPGIDEDHADEWPWPTSLSFDGFPLVFEKHCPWRTMFFPDPRALRKWVLSEFRWVNVGTSSQPLYLVPGKAGLFEAQGAMLFNVSTDETSPATCSVIRNISESFLDRVVAN